VTLIDVLVLAWVALVATSGFFRGFAAQLLSFAGVVAGLLVGGWAAPHLLPGGEASPWVPFASLVGAAIGAVAFGLPAGRVAAGAQAFAARRPVLRVADRIAGAAAGALVALALAWLAAVVFLHQSALGLRGVVQRSAILPGLVATVPPEPVLRALQRFDPFPVLPELAPRALPPPDPSVLREAGTRAAGQSVVKVEGTSCGLAVQGSGWVVREGLVATNVHVVSGQEDTRVLALNGENRDATIVYVDAMNDVALLSVPGLAARPLATSGSGSFPRPVALLGYPRDGPLVAVAGTAGSPRVVLAPDAYERGIRPRRVVPLRGAVEPGESGGPVVDRAGRVVAMIFGGARRGGGGFAVPIDLVSRALSRPLRPTGPGPCVG
jgi:S1-C subfamily serine protease